MSKMRGNYSRIDGGHPYRGVRFLRGGPFMKYNVNDRDADTGLEEAEVWRLLQEHLQKDDIITAGTAQDAKHDDSTRMASGMVAGHAYTILSTHTLKSDKTKIVKLRNPHHRDSFKAGKGAKYSAFDWVKAIEKEFPDAANKDDGIIYVPLA